MALNFIATIFIGHSSWEHDIVSLAVKVESILNLILIYDKQTIFFVFAILVKAIFSFNFLHALLDM